METQEPVVFQWRRKLAQRVSSSLDLIVSIAMASVIGTATILITWATLA